MTKYLVYKNLTRDKYSIKCAKTKLVVGHADKIDMVNCTFKVSENGRQRVLRDKQKNVHQTQRFGNSISWYSAYIVGEILGCEGFEARNGGEVIMRGCELRPMHMWSVTYNPYYTKTFIDVECKPVYSAERVYLHNKFGVMIGGKVNDETQQNIPERFT